MRSKKKQSNRNSAPIYRSIKAPSKAPSSSSPVLPGQIGEAAINAAALHQLSRYADDIQEFLDSSRMDRLLNQLQADLATDAPSHHRF